MVIKKKTNFDLEILRLRIQAVRSEVNRSKMLTKLCRDVSLYLCNQLLDGIERGKLFAYDEEGKMPIVSIDVGDNFICVRTKFCKAETIKNFNCYGDLDLVIFVVECIANKIGFGIKKVGREKNERLEMFFQG